MIPDVKNGNTGRQEFIDLLCRITKPDEETTANESEIMIIEDQAATVVEEGEIITIDDEEEKEVEDGELTGSQGSENDDVEELNLRLNALRSLAGAKTQKRSKPKKLRSRRRRSNDNHRHRNDDTDLRATLRNRSTSRHSNHDDREYLLDKDYRQTSVFDRLLSLISPNHNKKLLDNYDIQQMDIVDDYPLVPPLPSVPPPPPPLPPSHLPFFDPLPPLPPPPPSIFNMFPVHQSFPSVHWPRPNFVPEVQTDLWPTTFNDSTDVDLRRQSIPNHHHSTISPRMNIPLAHKKPPKQRRKRSKRRRNEREPDASLLITNQTEISKEQPNNNIDEDDGEDERLLREEVLNTLSNKRKVKIIEPNNHEPDRIVTIISSDSPPPLVLTTPTPIVVTKSAEIGNQSQYSINQRYKRVKATISSTSITTKTETTTVVRTTQPIFQTRNKIVRAPETDAEIPQSNPIIITFDEVTTDEEEPQTSNHTNESSYPIADEERQAIKRLQQLQGEVIRRSNAIESTTKTVIPKVQTPVETIQEAIPSTDELSALFEKRRMLLTERGKYTDIQEKMKKKKLENGLLAREIERLEEQLLTKNAQITNNNALLQYWQKEAMAIAQNIKQQEDLILQSAVFKSNKPIPLPIVKPRSTIEFDYANIFKVFEENTTHILLSLLICPLNLYRKLRPYHLWFKTVSNQIEEVPINDQSCLLLRTRSFQTQNEEQYWQTCLQSYFLDINQILCPYELQGSCKAQNCIYQHQHQITNRIAQFLSSKNLDKQNTSMNQRMEILNRIDHVCSLRSLDMDLSIFERKISEKQYQRCRMKLDRYLSIYHEDFRYFRDQSTTDIHPILLRVSNQLDSDDFSPERAVADLVEGLESQRTNGQLWCLYLEFSSWHMSSEDLHHLCSAAVKNAQSYDLFWTIFYLCNNDLEELISIYLSFIPSEEFDFHNRSLAICELAMFHASLASTSQEACGRLKSYLSHLSLENEHRVYLVMVLLFTFAFGSFPRLLYEQIDEDRFEKQVDLEAFICPWYTSSAYSHSQNEIDQFFDDFLNLMDLSEMNFPLYINKIHYLNATKRFTQSKVYTELLITVFPHSTELWIELLSNPELSQTINETLDRAHESTGIYYEFLYSLSSNLKIDTMLHNPSIPANTVREKFFFELCHLLLEAKIDLKAKKIEENLLRYNGELREIVILEILFGLGNFALDIQRRLIGKVMNCLLTMTEQQRIVILYSFFRNLPVSRVLDLLIDCFLSNHIDQYEWILKPFIYRCLEIKPSNTSIWIRFDAFAKQLINHSHCPEIYVTILQRLLTSMDDKNKIARLCRLFEKQFPHSDLISTRLRQIICQSTTEMERK